MDDNEKYVIDMLMEKTRENARLEALISSLHTIVDRADINATNAKYLTEGTISTDEIRSIFGWSMCATARIAINKREGKDA